MRTALLVLLMAACRTAPATSSTETPTTPAAGGDTQTAAPDPMFDAYEAATKWNMSLNGGEPLTEPEREALANKARESLKLACDQGQACACKALETGMCDCPEEAACTGEPFWFLGDQ